MNCEVKFSKLKIVCFNKLERNKMHSLLYKLNKYEHIFRLKLYLNLTGDNKLFTTLIINI